MKIVFNNNYNFEQFQKFWESWHNLYPLYKSLCPSMNKNFYITNIRSKVKESLHKNRKREFKLLICGSADEDTLRVVLKTLSQIETATKKIEIVLLDFYKKALNKSKKFISSLKIQDGISITYILKDILKLKVKNYNNYFDLIVSDGFLDYFNAKEKITVLKTWYRLLKNKGIVITTVPIEGSKSIKYKLFGPIISCLQILNKAREKKYPIISAIKNNCRMKTSREYLRIKYGKNTPFKNKNDLKIKSKKAGLSIIFFKPFFKYHSLGWMWYNTILKK